MNYSTINHINNLITKGCVYWRVTDTADKQLLALNESVTDPAESIELLTETLAEIQGNAVKITLSAKTAAQKGAGGSITEKANFVVFYKLATAGAVENINTRAAGGFNSDKLLELILMQAAQIGDLKQQTATAEMNLKFELLRLELKSKNTDNTNGADDLMSRLYTDVKHLVMAKEGLIAKPGQPVAGIEKKPVMQAVKTPGNAAEANEILNDSIAALAKADPNILTHLQQLATLAQNDPATYAAAVESLGALSNTGTNG
jgi:hypothetical protein